MEGFLYGRIVFIHKETMIMLGIHLVTFKPKNLLTVPPPANHIVPGNQPCGLSVYTQRIHHFFCCINEI